MNRNTNIFNVEPTIEIQRSKFKRHFNHKTTFNTGDIIPFYTDLDVLPATTIKNKTAIVLRLNTPANPTMDNLYLDTYYFKVPYWTVWEHFKRFMGENETGAWTQTTEYTIPQITGSGDSTKPIDVHDINAYMGSCRQGIYSSDAEWSALGVRAYIRTYNFWFRDQNLIAPVTMYDDDTDRAFDGTTLTGGTLLKACKFHDYFTACLPEPEKSPTGAITTPLGTEAPVIGSGKTIGITDGTDTNNTGTAFGLSNGLLVNSRSLYGADIGTTFSTTDQVISGKGFGVTTDPTKSGLVADLTQATAATINALRLAFATQRLYEKEARFGSRYHEIIRSQYGVNSPNASLHIPEYLGGCRQPINIETVLNNTGTTTSPLGYTGAMSVTLSINDDFTKSFDEHCVLLGLAVIRADHTYQQGQERQWSRKYKLDFYYPTFAHIGNQPVYNKEIFQQGTSDDNDVFGYKEAWAEYKYKPNRISGMLNSDYSAALDNWHYGDDYSSLPVLSQNWIEEPYEFVDRTLLVQSSTADQFTADIEIEQTVAAPMPVHCTPGLIDHF